MQLPRVRGVRPHSKHGRIRSQLPIDDHRFPRGRRQHNQSGLPQRLVGRIATQLGPRVGQIRRLVARHKRHRHLAHSPEDILNRARMRPPLDTRTDDDAFQRLTRRPQPVQHPRDRNRRRADLSQRRGIHHHLRRQRLPAHEQVRPLHEWHVDVRPRRLNPQHLHPDRAVKRRRQQVHFPVRQAHLLPLRIGGGVEAVDKRAPKGVDSRARRDGGQNFAEIHDAHAASVRSSGVSGARTRDQRIMSPQL